MDIAQKSQGRKTKSRIDVAWMSHEKSGKHHIDVARKIKQNGTERQQMPNKTTMEWNIQEW